jgi:hypothetical protein
MKYVLDFLINGKLKPNQTLAQILIYFADGRTKILQLILLVSSE